MKRTMRLHSGKMVAGLYDLCKLVNEKTNGRELEMVELGSYRGESTSIFFQLLNLKTLHCVDMWQENHEHKTDDISEAKVLFDRLFLNNKLIESHKKTTTDISFNNFDVDLVYVDADHRYEGVKKDLLFWKDKTKIISGHDYGMKKHPGVKKAVNEIVGKPDYVFEDYSWIKLL